MTDPCGQGERIATLEHQDRVVAATLSRLENKIDEIATLMGKLTVLESNHGHQTTAIDRAFKAINAIEAKQFSHDRFIWMAIGAGIAISVLWSVFGIYMNAQVTDITKGVAEMRAHIVADKIMNNDDVRQAK